MRNIYILLTATNSIVAKGIRFFTKKEYSHVSLSLDPKLNQLYSFARKNPYLILPGGFVHESLKYGTFKRFKDTKAILYSLEVTDEQFIEVEQLIINFKKNRKKYSFNVLGLLLAGFKIKFKRKRKMYCSEFVEFVLKNAITEIQEEVFVEPEDFKKINNLKLVFKGILKEICLN